MSDEIKKIGVNSMKLESKTALSQKNDDSVSIFVENQQKEALNNGTDENYSNFIAQSLESLDLIAEKYTKKDDLTLDDYAKIITLNQFNSNIESLSSQYEDEINSQGLVDNLYDFLKEINGSKITKTSIEKELESEKRANLALTYSIDNNDKLLIENIDNEFIARLKSSDTIEQKLNCFIEFCKDENIAIDTFNEYFKSINDGIFEDIRLVKKDSEITLEYLPVKYNPWTNEERQNDEYIIAPLNNNDILPPHLVELLSNNNVEPDILEKRGDFSDFSDVYKYFFNRDYDFKNIENYINESRNYSFINASLANIYDFSNKLSKANSIDDTMQIFIDMYQGDSEMAILEFNNFYNQNLEKINSPIKSLTARINDETDEVEYVFKTSNDEFILNDITSYSGDLSYYTNECALYEGYLAQINSDIKNDKILEQKFEDEYLKQNNITLQQAIQNYNDAYKQAFGENVIQDMLFEYTNDMSSYSEKLSSLITLSSAVLSFMCPAFGYGALFGAFSDNMIDGINMMTNKENDDYSKLIKDTIKEASYIAIGMGIGYGANSLNRTITSNLLQDTNLSYKAITALGTSAEVLADVSLGVGFDYLSVGDLNLSGNALSVLFDIKAGIFGYRAIQAGKNELFNLKDNKFMSYSKEGYTIYEPKGDNLYKATTYDINNRTNEISTKTTYLLNNSTMIDYKPRILDDETQKMLKDQAKLIHEAGEKYIVRAKSQAKELAEGMDCEVTARPKDEHSIYKKLERKYINRKLDLIYEGNAFKDYLNTQTCNRAIGDNYGTRLIFQPFSKDEAISTIGKLILNKDINTTLTPDEIVSKIENGNIDDTLKNQVMTGLKREYTKNIVDRMLEFIENGSLEITEINNYGTQAYAYLTLDQLYKINNANTNELNIITSIDDSFSDGLIYNRQLQKNSKKAIKETGYTCFQMNVKYKFDDVLEGFGEMQIRGRMVNVLADAEHIPYDIWLDKISPYEAGYEEVYPIFKNLSKKSRVAYQKYIFDNYEYMRWKEMGIELKKQPELTSLTLNNGTKLNQTQLDKISASGLCELYQKLHPDK